MSGIPSLLIDTYMTLPDFAFGGPLINAGNQLLGMNVPRFPGETLKPGAGEEHALPSAIIQMNTRMLMAFPTFEQPWPGFVVRTMHLEEAAAFYKLRGNVNALFVEFVWKDTEAAEKGVRPGDLLVEAGHQSFRNAAQFAKFLKATGIGKDVDYTLLRRTDENYTIKLKSIKRPLWAAP